MISISVRRQFRCLLAEMHGVSERMVTPEFMAVHTALHELGHARNYFQDYCGKYGETAGVLFHDDHRSGMRALPYGPMFPHILAARLQQDSAIGNVEKGKMVRNQAQAYMNIPVEKTADRFSVERMKKYGYVTPTLIL